MSDTEAQKAGAAAVRQMRAKPCCHDHEGVPADMRGRRMSCDECVAQAVLDTVTPTVPRVASSLDDLRVGQVVATICADGSAGECITFEDMHRFGYDAFMCGGGRVVILSDPPPVPVSVSRAVIDRLAEAVEQHDEQPCPAAEAARALLAEVRAQEPTP